MASLKVKTGPPHLCNTQAAQIDIVGETQNFLPTLLLLAFLHPPQYIKKKTEHLQMHSFIRKCRGVENEKQTI